MSFRIHSDSLPLKRDLEKRLAGLEGQIEEGFDYEISAEILPREQALDRAQELAQTIEAESVFVSENVFAVEKPQEEDPDFAMGLPSVADQKPAPASQGEDEEPTEDAPAAQIQSPRIDAQKIREAANARALQARATMNRAAEQTSSALKATQQKTAGALQLSGTWLSKQSAAAKAAGTDLKRRLAAKSAEWEKSLSEWNARRQERQRAESEARQERERAAHREAELAAVSAQVMMEQRRKEEAARRAAEATQPKAEPKPASRAIPQQQPVYRDTWPVSRSAFAGAACMALLALFLLMGSGKHTNATPATSTELSKPAIVVPAHAVEHPKPQPALPPTAAKAPEQIAKPAAAKRVARVRNQVDEEDFQEVTVRDYRIPPPKKDAKGVTQISDME